MDGAKAVNPERGGRNDRAAQSKDSQPVLRRRDRVVNRLQRVKQQTRFRWVCSTAVGAVIPACDGQ
jgi:hypothetical protein